MNSQVEMIFWDVQHGSATYIKTPNNRHIVVDLGVGTYSNNNLEFSPLRYLKNQREIAQLDCLIITHPHLDHIEDIMNVDLVSPISFTRPSGITDEKLMQEVREKDKVKFEKYRELNGYYRDSIVPGSHNDLYTPSNWGGVSIKTFNTESSHLENLNDYSIIIIIEYANVKVVLTGDNENDSLEELMEDSQFKEAVKDADILLAPHHGRKSGYYNDFVDQVNPRITIVSDGRHCDTSANSRYSAQSRGWKVFKSDGSSSVRKCLTTNSDGIIVVKFGYQNNERFLNIRI